ncbi:ABC transporter ATP-binding protein [Bosea caraganae]|uniref:ABC transporter ATP-binding protein n=1 Tax=Bosea caraganae TaxID=2763117 RepID=A0A370L6S1_9HYPH|nr:ABC transporter ATP-binding protein [Bosea caraganae]RDJ25457.1 ABC transporter ATP-binding protein [Bosea caraganae]RDJ25758.1 ABC transporter ATP-binding protein [Bosea caraganae]
MSAPLLQVRNVARYYSMRRGLLGRPVDVRAVDGVSLTVERGKTLGVVGESGSGKSTTGRLALGLEKPDAGDVLFQGSALPALGTAEWRKVRARMQMIYQDPLGALDRRLSILEQVREPYDVHGIGAAKERDALAVKLLQSVGLRADQGERYPHELSGGQRQRAVIARALATKPDLLVCDEPVSALDVSIQAQVINLLVDIQQELGLGLLFISHDLKVIRQVSHRVAVMYLGRIVEEGEADLLLSTPAHPYTEALVSAAPVPGRRARPRIVLQGDPPNPAARPSGCAFHPRCHAARERCKVESPALLPLPDGRLTACHVAHDQANFLKAAS